MDTLIETKRAKVAEVTFQGTNGFVYEVRTLDNQYVCLVIDIFDKTQIGGYTELLVEKKGDFYVDSKNTRWIVEKKVM